MHSGLMLAICVVLSVLSGAGGAPARPAEEMNFTKYSELSFLLNQMARDLYNTVESPNMRVIIADPPVAIRPIDSCDPWSLETNKETCQSRIIVALRNYTSIFHKDGVFKNSACSKWRKQANEIAEVTGDLLRLLKQPVVDGPLITDDWHDSALCRDGVERLVSFSITSARVFSFLAAQAAPKTEIKQC